MTWTAELRTWGSDPQRWRRERAASMLLFLARASDEETNPVDPSMGIGPDWLIPAQAVIGPPPPARTALVPQLARMIVADYLAKVARALDAANIAAPAYAFEPQAFDLVQRSIAYKLANPPAPKPAPAPAAPRSPGPRRPPTKPAPLPGAGPLLLACAIAAALLWRFNP